MKDKLSFCTKDNHRSVGFLGGNGWTDYPHLLCSTYEKSLNSGWCESSMIQGSENVCASRDHREHQVIWIWASDYLWNLSVVESAEAGNAAEKLPVAGQCQSILAIWKLEVIVLRCSIFQQKQGICWLFFVWLFVYEGVQSPDLKM